MKNYIKLVLLNISSVTLVGLIISFIFDYINGGKVNFIILIFILLILPVVINLSRDVIRNYKNLK